ncbi:PHB depolymerase family esterase [Kineococcus endophyticus]|uniref:PHB depolymerase family esterase n=1 Tax=Kineococcus endophyticus TaxID=1181883 RepID=A0ABV3P2Q1_9ACTN
MSRRTSLALAAVAVVAVAASTASSAGAAPATPAPRAAACTPTLPPGTQTVPIRFAGATTDVQVFVPSHRPTRVPLVLDLHGSSSNGPTQAGISDLKAVAEREGFVVANPTAAIELPPTDPPLAGGSWAWNVPGVPTTAGQFPPAGARDDVAFLSALLDQLGAAACVDTRRTYATGYSGGGRMASALACEVSDRIAAIAPVAGLRAGRPAPDEVSVPEVQGCTPREPVAVLTFHGTADGVNPYDGSDDLRWGYSAPVAAQTWARLNDCRTGPLRTTLTEHVTVTTYTRCAGGADVEFQRIVGGGHTWPGADEPEGPLGPITQEVDASETMWAFFEAHPKHV